MDRDRHRLNSLCLSLAITCDNIWQSTGKEITAELHVQGWGERHRERGGPPRGASIFTLKPASRSSVCMCVREKSGRHAYTWIGRDVCVWPCRYTHACVGSFPTGYHIRLLTQRSKCTTKAGSWGGCTAHRNDWTAKAGCLSQTRLLG